MGRGAVFNAANILRSASVSLAGLAVGYWKSLEDIRGNWSVDKVFIPGIRDERRNELLKGWNKAVKCALMWAEN